MAVDFYESSRLLSEERHYVDSKRVSEEPMPVRRPVRLGHALIGNWDPAYNQPESEYRVRNLMGRMDELLIIGRALTPKAMAEMYEKRDGPERERQ